MHRDNNYHELENVVKFPSAEPPIKEVGSLVLENIAPIGIGANELMDDSCVVAALVGLSEAERDLPPYEPIKTRPSPKEINNADDSVARYLSEIGRYPLLTKEDEQRLGRYVQRGRKVESFIKNYQEGIDSLNGSVEEVIREGKVAGRDFMLSNMRLVVNIAKRYVVTGGVDLLDLIQEGNFGLQRAVEKFDPDKGFRFSTYATWRIKQFIQRGKADMGSTIRIPVHKRERINNMRDTETGLYAQGLTPREVNDKLVEQYGQKGIELLTTYKRLQKIHSLHNPTAGSEGGLFVDKADAESVLPYEDVANQELFAQVRDAIVSQLNSLEVAVIENLFGMNGKPMSIEEAADNLNIDRKSITSIRRTALRKLAKLPVLAVLSDQLLKD